MNKPTSRLQSIYLFFFVVGFIICMPKVHSYLNCLKVQWLPSFNERKEREKNTPLHCRKGQRYNYCSIQSSERGDLYRGSSITDSDLEALVRAGPSSDCLSQVMEVSGREKALSHTAAPKWIWPRWRNRPALVAQEAEKKRRQGTSSRFALNYVQRICFFTGRIASIKKAYFNTFGKKNQGSERNAFLHNESINHDDLDETAALQCVVSVEERSWRDEDRRACVTAKPKVIL